MEVIKRDGSKVAFDGSKIENAILKAMRYGSGIVKPEIASKISHEIEDWHKSSGAASISIYRIEGQVFEKLIEKGEVLTAKAYEGYRKVREFQRETNTIDNAIYGIVNQTNKEAMDESIRKSDLKFAKEEGFNDGYDNGVIDNSMEIAKEMLNNKIDINTIIKCTKLSKEEIVNKKKELGLKESDFVILMIAELNENKNQIQLIKAMEVLKDKYPEIKAICVGEGDKLLELEDQVKNRGLKDKVIFLGFRNDINELINICNIGVLLSYREGLPRNLMELMACGKKVIATNIRGCRDIVVDESVGEIVEVGDYEATAKAIEEQYLYGDNEFTVSKEVEKYDVRTINEGLRLIYKDLEEGGYYHKEGYAYSANE